MTEPSKPRRPFVLSRLYRRAVWIVHPAGLVALLVSAALGGPAWIYGLRDGNSGNADGATVRGPIAQVLDMAKEGWEEIKFPLVLFLVAGIVLSAHRMRRGHDDARDEIKGRIIAIPLVIFMIPLAY